MGRLIDIDVLFDYFGNDAIDEITRNNIEYFVSEKGTVEAITKADYENRLKADMIAMLEDLDLQIDESAAYNREFAKVQRLIRDKINDLKEKDNDKNLCDTCGNSINCMMQSGIVRTECSMYRSPKNDLSVDCINRKKLIDWINIWDITPIIKNPLIRHIQGIPSVTPQEPRWIPCSERLPEENVDVLVVVEFPNGKDGTLQRIEISSFGLIYPLSSEKGWITNNFTRIARTEVIAWMPLPKP